LDALSSTPAHLPPCMPVLEPLLMVASRASSAPPTVVNTGLTYGEDHRVVSSLAIDPVTPSTLYAGTDGAGVFRSKDNGDHWTAVNFGIATGLVYSIAINPLTPTTLYIANGGRVWHSTDSGGHWAMINAGITYWNVVTLAINPLIPSTLYAGTQGGGIFRSTDSGTHWTAVNSGLAGKDGNGVRYSNFTSFAINPKSPSTLYVSTQYGVFRSVNRGSNWIAVKTGLANWDDSCLAINPVAPTTLYLGSQDGVLRSTDSGITWRVANTGD
jgi:photosystem II stability/assembly factor-like uncharacterized protein